MIKQMYCPDICVDCRKPVSKGSTRCRKCNCLSKFKGKHKPKKQKDKISLAMLGENNPMWKGDDVIYFLI